VRPIAVSGPTRVNSSFSPTGSIAGFSCGRRPNLDSAGGCVKIRMSAAPGPDRGGQTVKFASIEING
jgi:hypothetical protein